LVLAVSHADQFLDDYYFSASQIETWSSCKRKGGFIYLLNLRGFSSASQTLGKEVHKVLEDHAKLGTEIDTTTREGAIAIHALPYLPQQCVAEGEFKIEGRHKWRGYKDLTSPGAVWDYKTTSNFKWAKDEEVLRSDAQAMIYAKSEFVAQPDLEEIELNWLYLKTRTPLGAKRVILKVIRQEADEAFQALETLADDIIPILRGAQGLDDEQTRAYILGLDYNSGECEKFGGCQFRGLCNLSPEERFRGLMAASTTTLKARLMMAEDSLFARLRNMNKIEDNGNVSRLGLPGQSLSGVVESPFPATPVAVNPPEYQPPPATTPEQDKATAAAAREAEKARKAAEKAAKKPIKVADQRNQIAAEYAASVPMVTMSEQTSPPPAVQQQGKALVVTQPSPYSAPPATTPMINTLCIKCQPIGASTPFYEVLHRAKAVVKAEAGVDDWRFIPFHAGGVLLQAVTKVLDEMGRIDVLVVTNRSPELDVCEQLLRSRAVDVVVGL
jgi:hypothetical protein